MNKKSAKRRNAIVSVCLILALVIGGAFAYLTATDTKTNTFTVGKVDIEVVETEWYDANGNVIDDSNRDGIPDFAENIVPLQEIEKNPAIENTGENDAYVYLAVKIPTSNAPYLDTDVSPAVVANNNANSAVYRPLFTTVYDADLSDSTNQTTAINPAWVSAGADDETYKSTPDANGDTYIIKYYAYHPSGLESNAAGYAENDKVAPDATTPVLFTSVVFANLTESNNISAHTVGDAPRVDINVTGYAIQADELDLSGVGEANDSDVEKAWTVINNQRGDIAAPATVAQPEPDPEPNPEP